MTGPQEFLFDKYCSGRSKYGIHNGVLPVKVWETKLRAYPPAGPESTAVMDDEGNLYFGSHDGCFYSVNPLGAIRFMFKVGRKIYSSPVLYKNRIFISSGDGFLLSFDQEGNLLWSYDICRQYRGVKNKLVKSLKTFAGAVWDCGINIGEIHKYMLLFDCLSWSSPKAVDDHILITGYGIGLHALDYESGKVKWQFSLPTPKHPLCGVAVNRDNDLIVLAQKRYFYCIDSQGTVKWRRRLKTAWDNWSTPAVDPESEKIYFASSKTESKSMLFCYDKNGNLCWSRKNDSAIRGSVSISHENYVVALDFKGFVHFLNKMDGSTLYKLKVSEAERALWTSAAIDPAGNILFTVKDSHTEGSLICLNKNGDIVWRLNDVGKALSTPVIDKNSRIYIGTWKGKYVCYQC